MRFVCLCSLKSDINNSCESGLYFAYTYGVIISDFKIYIVILKVIFVFC